jgi:hypothetical protein
VTPPAARSFSVGWFLPAAVLIAVMLGAAVGLLLRSEPLPAITAPGDNLQEKVDSALRQVNDRYPNVSLEIRGLSSEGVLLHTGWKKPDADDRDYVDEVQDRAQDQREATVAFFQALARTDNSPRRFGAFEDRLLISIWSRRQILSAGDPARYRDFTTYSAFRLDAAELDGYSVISGAIKGNQND